MKYKFTVMISQKPLVADYGYIPNYREGMETNSFKEACKNLKECDSNAGYLCSTEIPYSMGQTGFIDFNDTNSYIKIKCLYNELEAEINQLFGSKE